MVRWVVTVFAALTTYSVNAQDDGWHDLTLAGSSSVQRDEPAWAQSLTALFSDADTLDVLIEFRTTPEPEQIKRERATSDKPRDQIAVATRRAVAERAGPLSTDLRALGFEITQTFTYQPIIRATMTQRQLRELALRDDIVAVSMNDQFRAEETTALSPREIERPKTHTSTSTTRAAEAWAKGFRGQGFAVAILDTGILATHEMFKSGKIAVEACFSNGLGTDESLCPGKVRKVIGPGSASHCEGGNNVCDHGTHVAGIAAGNSRDNSLPRRGMAPESKLIPIQVFSRVVNFTACKFSSSCLLANSSDIIEALDWLIANGATYNLAAVNMSLGGGMHANYCTSDPHNPGITTLRNMGILTTVAAGNDGLRGYVSAPGCVKNAVTVSGTQIMYDYASSAFNQASMVDLLAPGTFIKSATVTSPTSYGYKDGTSMAAPHVAGAIAVLKSKMPTATADQVEYALKAGGRQTTLNSETWTTPRIDVARALDVLGQDPPPPGIALPGFYPSAMTAGTSYLRLMNPSTSSSTARITLVQDTPKKIMGTHTITVPARAALQSAIKDFEAAIGQAGVSTSALSLYIDASFRGFAQNILMSTTSQALSNLSVCKTTNIDPNTFLGNLHTSRVQNYPSTIRIHSQNIVPMNAVFDLYHGTTGAFIATLGTATIPPSTSLSLSAAAGLGAVRFDPGVNDYHINFVLRPGFEGVVAHMVESSQAGVLTDMTAKCPI